MKFNDIEIQPPGFDLSSALTRVTHLLNSRYGCSIQFKPLADLTENEKIDLCCSNFNSTKILFANQIQIPLSIKGDLVGSISILNGETYNHSTLSAIRRVISILIESLNRANHFDEILLVLEEHLNTNKSSNVVPINKYRNSPVSNVLNLSSSRPTRSTFNSPCWIECKNSEDLLKMALEVHEQSRRFAFLHFNQIDDQTRVNSTEFAKLGNVSVFIPEVCNLKDLEIFALIELLKTQNRDHLPQIIVGTSISLSEIYKSQLLPKELIELLKVAYLKMSQPFSNYKQSGFLKIFFENF